MTKLTFHLKNTNYTQFNAWINDFADKHKGIYPEDKSYPQWSVVLPHQQVLSTGHGLGFAGMRYRIDGIFFKNSEDTLGSNGPVVDFDTLEIGNNLRVQMSYLETPPLMGYYTPLMFQIVQDWDDSRDARNIVFAEVGRLAKKFGFSIPVLRSSTPQSNEAKEIQLTDKQITLIRRYEAGHNALFEYIIPTDFERLNGYFHDFCGTFVVLNDADGYEKIIVEEKLYPETQYQIQNPTQYYYDVWGRLLTFYTSEKDFLERGITQDVKEKANIGVLANIAIIGLKRDESLLRAETYQDNFGGAIKFLNALEANLLKIFQINVIRPTIMPIKIEANASEPYTFADNEAGTAIYRITQEGKTIIEGGTINPGYQVQISPMKPLALSKVLDSEQQTGFPSQRSEEKKTQKKYRYAPNKKADYDKWVVVWKKVKGWVIQYGMQPDAICAELNKTKSRGEYRGPIYKVDTMRKIIRAGHSGELDPP